MKKSNKALPQDNSEVVRLVREYLTTLSLGHCSGFRMADHLGAPYGTIQNRLAEQGTSWRSELGREKARRLQVHLDRAGRLDIDYARDDLGFSSDDNFYKFFKRAMDQTFTEYRMGVAQF